VRDLTLPAACMVVYTWCYYEGCQGERRTLFRFLQGLIPLSTPVLKRVHPSCVVTFVSLTVYLVVVLKEQRYAERRRCGRYGGAYG
jgi:hypothetical protein